MPKKKPEINLASLQSSAKSVTRPVDKLKQKTESEAKVPIQIYCTEEQKKQLKLASINSGRSMTSLMLEAIDSVIAEYK